MLELTGAPQDTAHRDNMHMCVDANFYAQAYFYTKLLLEMGKNIQV